ncbi:hypothetical protein A4X13_0g8270 [Tilletia indica]|uniref:Uncharacterized protein n=1 Tax=Tilletia indica TaxID=43049 RepID=A0A177T2F8_9BASI|nr:hypothetical protein A4X13_0g8270 [Tilletia indica]
MIDASDDLCKILAEEDAAAAELRDKVSKFYEMVDAIFEGGIANGEFALDPGAKASKNAKEENSVILVPTRILLILHLPLTVRKSKERTKTVDGQTGGERKSEGASAEDNELQNAVMFFNLNDKAHFTTMEKLDVIDYFNGNKRGPFTYMAMSKAENADRRVNWLRKNIFSA